MQRLAALAIASLLVAATLASAHDIPASIVIQAFLRPEGSTARLLVRVPLAAMRDVEFPLKDGGRLDLARADQTLRDAARLWIARDVVLYEGNTRLPAPRVVAARASLPSDRSFETYESARAHLTGAPLPADTDLIWNQAMLDVGLEYPIASDRSTFSIKPTLARLGVRVVTVLRYHPPAGAERAFELVGDPGLVRLDPRWYQAALRFVRMGIGHILDGTDHLLFLACLVIPFRRIRPLIVIVTAFTLAHSLTLIAAASGFVPDALWFTPLVETLIAASILYMALENIVGANSVQRRWALAFAFGLVHGFGFSFALRETVQFAGSHLLTALLAFNVGVEIGQLLVLALLVPSLGLLFRYAVAPRMGVIVLSALVAHTAWHWTAERWETLRQFDVPSATPITTLGAIRGAIVVVALAALVWLVRTFARARSGAPAVESSLENGTT